MILATPEALSEAEGADLVHLGGHQQPRPSNGDVGTMEPEQGLGRSFAVGQQIPWRGLWFEIEAVSYDRLTLKPVGTTFKRWKQLQKEKKK